MSEEALLTSALPDHRKALAGFLYLSFGLQSAFEPGMADGSSLIGSPSLREREMVNRP
jgi:hypothetical protein